MECLIHIGLHKTGTTAIQNGLYNYDDGQTFYANFEEKNHSIPIYTAFAKDYIYYHIWKKRGMSQEDIELKRSEVLYKLENQLKRKDRDKIIISGEDISSLDQDGAVNFLQFLKLRSEKIKVIAYVRNPLEYARSAFQEQVKSGIDKIPSKVSQQYKFRLEKFYKQLGDEKFIVRDYDSKSDIVLDFCEELNLDISLAKKNRSGESISSDAIKMLFEFNKTNPVFYGDIELMKAWNLLKNVLNFVLTSAEKIPLECFYNIADLSEVEWLNRKFNIDYKIKDIKDICDLENWMSNITIDIQKKMEALLENNGIIVNYKNDQVKLVNRLFYLCVKHGKFNREKLSFW